MKRWKNKLAAAVVMAGGLVGCKQPLYMTVEDFKSVTAANLPQNLQNDPNSGAVPNSDDHLEPRNIDRPDGQPRYMTLPEAIALSLESGNRGSSAVFNFAGGINGSRGGGLVTDDLITFQGGALATFNDDSIRAFALDPAIVGANIEGALAKFDTRFITSAVWNKVDTATPNLLSNFNNGDTAQFSTGLFKPLPTGGTAGITFNTNYQKLSNPPAGFAVINPAYQPSLNFSFEQPLLRDYGIEINQLLAQHPGSTQTPGLTPSGGRPEGILVTRIRFEQARADFERTVNIMLFNVENAYWALYASYFQLYAAEQGLRQAYLTWQLKKSEFDAGKATLHEVAQVRAQFANFRRQRIDALQGVLESERQLRGLVGLKMEDGLRIIPADAPTLAPFNPDWTTSLAEALANRPELLAIREDLKVRQFEVMLQRNSTRPDLRFFADYNVNSIGTRLDGSSANSAFGNLADNKFNNWTTGIRLNVPIGFRDAHAALQASQLNLARTYLVLKNQERRAEFFLGSVHQNLHRFYRQIEATQERRKNLAEQLKGLYARIKAGKDPLITILTAQSDFATALSDEYSAIANYNIAIAALQYAKGTLMQYNNVKVADGPLPGCTLTRAADHERQRTVGLVARDRATVPIGDGPHPLPSLLEHQPKTPDLPPDLEEPTGAFNPAAPNLLPGIKAAGSGPREPLNPSATLPPAGQPYYLPTTRDPNLSR